MPRSKIIAVETQNPASGFTQEEIAEHVLRSKLIPERAALFYRRFLSDRGIRTRYFGMESLGTVDRETPDEANRRFQKVASQIGGDAVAGCIARAGLAPHQIDGLVVTTCTGYLCPGLSSYVAEAAGLREDIYTADLVGIGCAAALPALRTADNYLQNHPGHRVIVLCAEVSSAALSWGDRIDLILSNCIFADGAAACLLSRRDPGPGFEIGKFESILWPQYRDDLRFEHAHSRLSNVISPRVPEVAALAVRNLFERISKKEGGGFRHFAFHPGGRKVLDGIRAALDLTAEDMEPSRAVLRDYGNMSSPSVLYVLKNILEERSPKQGDSLLLFSFGAGFSAFAASLAFAGAGGLAVAGADKRADAGVDV